MIPILYESTETSFTSNGIGRLSDAVSCVVTEERNGPYELEMEYPTTGIHYSDIQLFRIIFANPADGKSGQPFEIYDISRPLNGIVTIRAWHLSYRLNRIVVKPFTAASCGAALPGLKTNSITTNPFTFGTDKDVSATFTVKTPTECRGLLGGQAGSILDVYGKGDYEFDKFSVYLHTNRGSDNGVTIRYGKNLTDLDAESGMDNVYTGIVPYYYNEDTGELVTVTGYVLWGDHRSDYPVDMVRPVDLSDKWDETAPTAAQLQTAAESYLDSNTGWELSTNLKVEFVALADTEEYKAVSALQRVNLCDTVTIIHEGLGITAAAKVVKTEYDVLLERYNSIELGTASVSLGQAIEDSIINSDEVPTTSAMQRAIANGTALITGNSGGYVVLKKNANGKPEELLILGPESLGDIDRAVNVWRFNNAGLGFSPNGYDGPYNAAWTYDGKFYIDWVTAGAINAALVNTGTISSKNGKVQIVLSETGNTGQLIVDSDNFVLDAQGNVSITGEINAQTGRVGGWEIIPSRLQRTVAPTASTPGFKVELISPGTIQADGSTAAIRVQTAAATSGDPSWENQFLVRYNGTTIVKGEIIADSGKIGGDNGLIVDTNKVYVGKTTLLSGTTGIYIGTDGISFGSFGGSAPLLWFDNTYNEVRVTRLDFYTWMNNALTRAHSILVDGKKRLSTGYGWNIGYKGTDGDGTEDDTCIGGTTYASVTNPSDRRIKKNIQELDEDKSREFIMACKPVEFEYSEESYPEGVHHGLIAQDVQKIAGDWNIVRGDENRYSLTYTEMIADLIKVCQNQERRIEALEAALKEKE